jgi:hypothetical protein
LVAKVLGVTAELRLVAASQARAKRGIAEMLGGNSLLQRGEAVLVLGHASSVARTVNTAVELSTTLLRRRRTLACASVLALERRQAACFAA